MNAVAGLLALVALVLTPIGCGGTLEGQPDSGPSSGDGDGGSQVDAGAGVDSGISNDSDGGGGEMFFDTLPVGASLPSDAECAARVKPAPETRSVNATFNATRGTNPHDEIPRVTGDFVGTTDEILQWAACKWGINEDVVRAQIALESYWDQNVVGDNGESFGLGQVRVPYHGAAFEDDNSKLSSAYNVDYTYAMWRKCFEGEQTWLNDFDPPMPYGSGDMWGCLGLWFSGRWYPPEAVEYIGRVQGYLDDRIWTTGPFLDYDG